MFDIELCGHSLSELVMKLNTLLCALLQLCTAVAVVIAPESSRVGLLILIMYLLEVTMRAEMGNLMID